MFRLPRSRMLCPADGERTGSGVLRTFLYFLAVFGMGSFGRFLIYEIGLRLFPDAGGAVHLLFDLFGTTAGVVSVILWCRFFERRDARRMGFVKRGAVAEYAMGALGGVVLFCGAVGVCVLCGVATVQPTDTAPSWWLLVLFLLAFLIQGLSEELLCRSLLMLSLSRAWPLWACVTANAAAFSLLHLLNAGITVPALLNIFLFGVLASVLMLKRGSIWSVAALHSLWNFAQGNLFGIPVSGIEGAPSPLVTVTEDDTLWKVLVGGGNFGIEGGIAATIVLLIGLLVVLLLPPRDAH